METILSSLQVLAMSITLLWFLAPNTISINREPLSLGVCVPQSTISDTQALQQLTPFTYSATNGTTPVNRYGTSALYSHAYITTFTRFKQHVSIDMLSDLKHLRLSVRADSVLFLKYLIFPIRYVSRAAFL